MTQATSLVDSLTGEASDAELISRVRGGDVDSYGGLFARHREAATRLARQLVPGPDADDLVSEAFVKVMNVLLGGGGPDVAFRAYLLTAVRRLHVDKIRATRKATPTDDLTPYDDGVPFSDTVVAGFEGGAAAKAFASLPERWQLVLWHLEVEGNKPADVAPLLGMTPNSVSALAYRAREGLRQAFLQMHAADLVSSDCQRTHDLLGAYVRNGLSRRDSVKVDEHLEGCRKCTAIYLELTEVNSELAGLLAPLVLGGAAAGYLAAGSATVAGGGFLVGGITWLKDAIGANSQAAVAVGATAVVAAAAIAAVAVTGGDRPPVAEPKQPGVEQPVDPPPAPPPAEPPAPKPEPPQPPPAPAPGQTPPAAAPAPEPDPPPVVDPVDEPPTTPPKPDPTPPDDPGTEEPPPPPPPPPPATSEVLLKLTVDRNGQSENYTVAIAVNLLNDILPTKLTFTLTSGTFGAAPTGCALVGDTTLVCDGSVRLIEIRIMKSTPGAPIHVVVTPPLGLPAITLPDLLLR